MQQIEKTVSVAELKELFQSGEYEIEIDTPDGYQPITAWFDKGVLNMVTVETEDFSSTCAVNHLIQKSDLSWLPAADLVVGDLIITASGVQPVTAVTSSSPEECFDFTVDHPNHRYYGDGIVSHNSGKSFIASGNLIKNAQDQGIFVVLLDTENSADRSWVSALGVDTSEDKLLKISVSMIDDIAKIISDFVTEYKKDYLDLPASERPKILFVIDSLGMALSSTETAQFADGQLRGDFGRKPKQLKALVTNCVNMFGNLNIGLVCTNHCYASQDPFAPESIISGGSGFVYAASIVVAMKKLNLKEDELGNKISDVVGIRSVCKVVKSRYSKPFETVKINIPYETGMNPISGLFDLFEKTGKLTKQGNRYKYICKDGTEMLYFRKEWNDFEKMKIIMDEFSQDDLGTHYAADDVAFDTDGESEE